MTNNAYIGIDLGTSGCRAIAIDDDGNIIAQHQQTLPNSTSITPHSEQDPQQHWQCVEMVLTQLFSQLKDYQVKNIAVDATSGSVLLVDEQGEALTPILMYNDARATVESDIIKQRAHANSGAHGASSGLAKLLYLQQHTSLPTQYKLLHQADWLNHNLGADLAVTDYNNALKSGYDPVKLCWPDWLLEVVSKQVLPKVVKPGTVIGQLSATLKQKFQLSYSPNIVAGTTDSIAGFLATQAHNIGDAVTSLGSSLVLKLISDTPIFVAEQGVYSHRLADHWLAGGASNSGGAALRYFFTNQQIEELSSQIDLNKQAADYYPLIGEGERFPILDPHLSPKLTPRPQQDSEFLHGLFNGIATIEAKGYSLLQQHGAAKLSSIRTVGGGAKNQIWQTIRQQHIAVPFIEPQQTEAAYGAALLARDQLKDFYE